MCIRITQFSGPPLEAFLLCEQESMACECSAGTLFSLLFLGFEVSPYISSLEERPPVRFQLLWVYFKKLTIFGLIAFFPLLSFSLYTKFSDSGRPRIYYFFNIMIIVGPVEGTMQIWNFRTQKAHSMGNSCTSSFIAYFLDFQMSDFLLWHYGLMVFWSGHMSINKVYRNRTWKKGNCCICT